MSKKLTRDVFATPPTLPRKAVYLPELDGEATVRRMTAGERSQYQNALIRMTPGSTAAEIVLEFAEIRLAALTLIDPDTGDRLFPDVDEGVAALGAHSAETVNLMVEAARELNPSSKEEVQEAVDDLKATASDDSSST